MVDVRYNHIGKGIGREFYPFAIHDGSTLREKKKLPGPAHYDLHQIMDRWRLERTCSTKI